MRKLPRPQCQPNQTYCTSGESFLTLCAGLWARAQACHQNRKKERKSLEATVLKQGSVKPSEPTTDFKGIIVCSFYCPPHNKKKTQLVEHISINYSELKTRYKDCFFITGGDKNDINVKHILDISPSLHMHNTKPTHGKKNIDVLISDMVPLFNESIIIPNVPTDIPDGQPGGGKVSDHPIVYCEPRLDTLSKPAKQVVVKKTRRINEERKRKLANWVQNETWEDVTEDKCMAEAFIKVVNSNLDRICPEEEVKISQMDGRVNSLALQRLARQKQREFTKNRYSKKYKEIKKKIKERIKKEGEKAIENLLENARREKGTKWVREANRISGRPGEDSSSSFVLPAHVDANFTPKQSADAMVEYFSKISQEYTPIEEDISACWMEVQNKLNKEQCSHPTILHSGFA